MLKNKGRKDTMMKSYNSVLWPSHAFCTSEGWIVMKQKERKIQSARDGISKELGRILKKRQEEISRGI